MTLDHRATAALAAVALALTLAACGGADEPVTDTAAATSADADAAPAGTSNDADAEFAQMMVLHHEGAIEMAELAVDAAATDDVRALAEDIAAAQGPEIETMTGWLEQWGEDMPHDAAMGDMAHHGMEMDGMDQAEVMDELRGLSGTDFDRRFLELMIEHHRGAIDMAEAHREDGENTEALALAGTITSDQRAEIARMEQLLDGL